MRAFVLYRFFTVFTIVCQSLGGFAQDEDFETFKQGLPRLAIPETQVIALLSENKSDLWDTISVASHSKDSVKALASKHRLVVKEISTGSDDNLLVVIDERVLETKLDYEVAILENVLNLLRKSAISTLGQISTSSPDTFERYALWLEQYSPYRVGLARWINFRYRDIIICPVGFVYISDGEKSSICVGVLYPSGEHEISVLGRQMSLYQPELKQEITQKPREEIEKRIAEINRFYTKGNKVSLHWINCDAETVREVAYQSVSQAAEEREKRLQQIAQNTKREIYLTLVGIFASRYKISAGSSARVGDIFSSLQIKPEEINQSPELSRLDTPASRATVDIVPGLIIGFLDKVEGSYDFARIKLNDFSLLSVGMIDVKKYPDLETLIDLKF